MLHEAWLKEMERYFHERGRVMAPSNRKQAELPASAEFINNPVGTTYAVQLNRCLMFFTPGVPSEFKVMVARNPAASARAFFFTTAAGLSALDYLGRSESDLAREKPGHSTTAAGGNNGLSLLNADHRTETRPGPASEQQAMEKLWLDVKRVAGQSVIFEGTEGLPAQISRELQNRQFSLTLSEQFTGGLLALQLSRAGAPLLACEVRLTAQEETLAQTAHWITERRANHFAGLALAVSGFENEHLNFALATPDGTFALRVHFSTTRYSLAIRQEVCAMMALNMLRRWLNGQDIASEHGWIEVVESMTLSV